MWIVGYYYRVVETCTARVCDYGRCGIGSRWGCRSSLLYPHRGDCRGIVEGMNREEHKGTTLFSVSCNSSRSRILLSLSSLLVVGLAPNPLPCSSSDRLYSDLDEQLTRRLPAHYTTVPSVLITLQCSRTH